MSNQTAVPMTPEQKFFFDLRGWILTTLGIIGIRD